MSFRRSGLITFKHSGNFNNTESFLKKVSKRSYMTVLKTYAERGVRALSESTPKDTGLTASSWRYEIKQSKDEITINWFNDNVVKGVNIAVILQYGHGTKNGGYVKGRDYINPAIRPIFDEICENVWGEITKKN